MAASSSQTLDSNSDVGNQPSSTLSDSSPVALPPAASIPSPAETPASGTPNSIPNLAPLAPPPPAVPSFVPSFRPLGVPPVPQNSGANIPMTQNHAFLAPMGQAPSIHPPGVSNSASVMPPGAPPGAVLPLRPGIPYQVVPGQPPAPMPYAQVGNGYMAVPPQGPMAMPPPGMPRYPAPYPMIRPVFPLRPIPPTGLIPAMPRPPIPGFRGLPPVATPIVRPIVPVVTPIEKPQTTVYVGKISATVENEFLLSILTLCGPVKSWKRAQDPSDGTPKAFGFCEFESAEGVLRSLRLLSKLNIDGQELMLNINQATREYLERYVERKAEKEKQKEVETGDPANERDSKESTEKQEQFPRPIEEGTNKDSADKENQVGNKSFGLVTDEDREFDAVALEKLTGMIEERLKNKPLPPPMLVDGSVKCTSDTPSKSKDGDSDADIMKSDAAEEKNDDDTMSENKPTTESDKPETPDRSKRHDNRSRERDRERDLKREKERELERVERERERERVRRERDREMKLREAERLYKDRLKEWEAREREKEYQRQYEKEREKERDRERWKEIMRQEDESSGDDDDDSRKRRRRTSLLEEKRKKRQHEKEEDFEDRLKEKEQIAEAKRRATEEQVKLETKQLKLESKSLDQVIHEDENAMQEDENFERKQIASSHANDVLRNDLDDADGIYRNSSGDDLNMMAPIAVSDKKQNAPARKLGFGLIGSGKRTTVPSVFHEEDDEDLDEKKMRPLVPIDYSTEELQAVQANASGSQPNLVAAAEFAKRISGVNPKDEKADINRERSRRSSDKQNLRDRDRNDDESSRSKDESREKMHDRNIDREKSREDKPKTENKKLFDAKQLIDMIPKTKEELFVYEINWDVYDKHHLHERMRPWISKKITEFLGEEEATLVDYIVSCIKDHVQASTMLEMLQSILDDEAEMFVLKMWRMLIFEIKKVETGLSMKSKS